MESIYQAVTQLLDDGGAAMLVTVVQVQGSAPSRVGGKMLVYAGGRTIGTVGGGALEQAASTKALELLERQRSELVRYSLTEDDRALDEEPSGMVCGGHVTLFYDVIGQGQRVYIYGGGHVGQALVRQLRDLPYYVTVIDHRPEVAESIVGADRVIVVDYATALEDEPVPAGSYFVVATPSHEFDYVSVKRIMSAGWKPAYVGVLGSTRKARANAAKLDVEMGDRVDWQALHCPVGLDLGGPTPAEIALAIAAEMQAIRYGRDGHLHMNLSPSQS